MFSRTEGGLLVPEGAHEEAVRDALKRHDPELRLVPVDSTAYGERVYKVARYMGPNHPVEWLLFWGDERGNPYPLSFSIVDAVQKLDRNMRGFDPRDADAKNAELLAQRERHSRSEGQALAEDFQDRISGKKRTILPRSRGLYAARNRVRARTSADELRP